MFNKTRGGYRQESYTSEDGIHPDLSPQHETVELEANPHSHHHESRLRLTSESTTTMNPEGCCCCSARFFTTRCALVSTVTSVLVLAFLVLVLDLGIREAEVLGHSRPYGDPVKVKNLTLVTFTLRGTPSDYAQFEAIPINERGYIYSVELDYVDMELRLLVSTFDYWRWNNLKTMTMRNVRLSGSLHSDRPWPPDTLESFHLEYNHPIGRDVNFNLDVCDHCVTGNASNRSTADISALKDRECLNLLLLYKPAYSWSGNLAELSYNFSISVMGWTLVRVNNVTGEVTSTLPYSDELVRNATKSSKFGHGIRKLRLRDTKLNVTTLLALSSSLVVLQLDNVEIIGLQGQRVSQLLTNFNRLEVLCLKFGPFLDKPGTTEVDPHFVILLDDLPTSLKSLTLAHVQLNVNPGSLVNFHLDTLTLYHTDIMNDEILTNFSRHFKVDRLAWQVEGSKGQYTMKNNWVEVLERLSGADYSKWIFLDNSLIGSFVNAGGAPLRPSGFVLTLPVIDHAFLMSTAGNFTYYKWRAGVKGQVSLSPVGIPRRRWFELLQIDSFLEPRLMDAINW